MYDVTGRDSVAETCTPASALYVIESAANGARLQKIDFSRRLSYIPTIPGKLPNNTARCLLRSPGMLVQVKGVDFDEGGNEWVMGDSLELQVGSTKHAPGHNI